MHRAVHPPGARVRAWLLAQWFRPDVGLTARLLRPLAWLYGQLLRRSQQARQRQSGQRLQPQRPVVVVGNLIVGGAGKTPATIAVVHALRAAGHHPGVVSRGHGRASAALAAVGSRSEALQVGDEPLLIHRRTGAPTVVGRDRVAAAHQLLALHPEVDVIVADDGLQHRQLRRDVEIVVFDDRGIGNGLLLPAGPLREPFEARPGPLALVLYTCPTASTPWAGDCAPRALSGVWPLAGWIAGTAPAAQALASLRGRRLVAMAGIAVPERFFAALEAAGLTIDRLPLPDHHRYDSAPWPAGTRELVTTEKDAVKLTAWAGQGVTIWVVGLDLPLPATFVATLLARLRAASPT